MKYDNKKQNVPFKNCSIQHILKLTTVFDLIGARGAYVNLFSTTIK